MLIKYSALVSGASGKLNGSVAARNKGGDYLRNKTTPVNPQSAAQQLARANFGGMSSQFRQLTPAQVDAWNSAAANFPYTNIFGDSKTLNGLQLFTKLNTNMGIASLPVMLAPPEPQGAGSIILESITMQNTANTTVSSVVIDEGDRNVVIVVEATAPVAGNARFYKNRFRQISVGAEAVVLNGGNLFIAYASKWGEPPVGANVAYRVSLLNTDTGERSVGSVVRATVTNA